MTIQLKSGKFFIIAGIIITIIGILSYIPTNEKPSKYSERVTATIVSVDMTTRISIKRENGEKTRSRDIVYIPHFTYTFDDLGCKGKCEPVESESYYKVGEEIPIYVDPENPRKYILHPPRQPSEPEKSNGWLFIGFGILITAASVIEERKQKREAERYGNY